MSLMRDRIKYPQVSLRGLGLYHAQHGISKTHVPVVWNRGAVITTYGISIAQRNGHDMRLSSNGRFKKI